MTDTMTENVLIGAVAAIKVEESVYVEF